MFSFKKNYYLIIENTKDIDLSKVKKRNKFTIIFRNQQIKEKYRVLLNFKRNCKQRGINLYVANNIKLARLINCDGIYLSSYNKNLRFLRFISKKFKIIGSAHNRAEIDIKKKQGCTKILLSRLFKTNYKNKKDYLGLIKFNLLIKKFNCNLCPLGGIRISNINRLKNINTEAFAILSEVKKKPAIISRLF